MAAERRLPRQDRQVARVAERLDTHHRVVAPERTAIADPPRLPHRVGAHACAHPELERPRECRRRRHAHHQRLQDAELRIRLHHPHHLDDRGAGHDAVGIERQHQFELVAPTIAEIAHVAGLETSVVGAPAIRQALTVGIGRLHAANAASSLAATSASLVSDNTK